MRKLHVGTGLALPLDAVGRTFGILAQRGAGKSNGAVVLAEEMFAAGLHWVAIDPKGDWHGLRTSADGKKPGLPIVIFGGAKGDVPLEPTGGALLADLVVDEALTCVLDVSEFTESEKIRFLAGHGREEGFAGRLFRRKNGEQDPTHVFLEEADDYIPQRPFKEQAKLVHVFGKLVKMGRSRGLGATLISQRSARIHKDVLTQIDTLVVLRTTGPQDRKAVADWLKYHGEAEEILKSLPSLKDGEAWLWSPEWLGETRNFRFRRRETFDTGATPTHGKRRRPATRADVDLSAFAEKMQATIERAAADDPVKLRQKIKALEAEIEKLKRTRPEPERVEVPVLSEETTEPLRTLMSTLVDQLTTVDAHLLESVRVNERLPQWHGIDLAVEPEENGRDDIRARNQRDLAAKGPRLVLIAIAQQPKGATPAQLTVLTGYKKTTRDLYIRKNVAAGFAERFEDRIFVTTAGIAELGDDYQPLPTGGDLRRYWLAKLPAGEAKVLTAIVDVFPGYRTRDEISELTGYKKTTRDLYIRKLAARHLIATTGGMISASEDLF